MGDDFPRIFGKIQKKGRIAITSSLLKRLGWEIGDQVLIEAYQGKLIVENLKRSIRPLKERLK